MTYSLRFGEVGQIVRAFLKAIRLGEITLR